MSSSPVSVICLAGPTGAGKTALALELARRLDGEIVNADSRQVYADFPIICAQPSPEEQAVVPHHLYGFLPTERKISAGQWADMAHAKAVALRERGKTPILVGGTGMYFHTLLHGIATIPPVDATISKILAERLRNGGAPALHAELADIDPVYAARIHPNDSQRIVRALEVAQGTGKPFSWWHENAMAAPLCRGPLLVIDATLVWLEPRLGERIRLMLAAGALDEGRKAMTACSDANAPGWSGIGCAEVLGYLTGQHDLETCRTLWFKHTRAYAKRQLTWFHGRREALLFAPGGEDRLLAAAEAAFSRNV